MTGKRMFDRMIFMRPRPKDITPVENGFIYTFDCTQRQADYYFFRFGVDAEILEPQDLREKFATKHKCAADLYNPI